MLRPYQASEIRISMSATDQLRSDLIEQIQTGDESFLRIVHAVAEAYRQEHARQETDPQVIGYQAGEEMNPEALSRRVAAAEDQIDRGEFYTPEQLAKETEEWLSSIK
jgi:hypothetical protein